MNNVVVIVFMLFASDSSFFLNALVSSRSISRSINLNQIENRVLNFKIDRIIVQIDLKFVRHVVDDMWTF